MSENTGPGGTGACYTGPLAGTPAAGWLRVLRIPAAAIEFASKLAEGAGP